MRKLVSFTFWTLDAFVAGLFVLAWLGRHVRPDGVTWPLQLIAIGFPYLTAAVAVLLVVQVFRRKWRSVTVHAILLAFAFVRYGGAPTAESETSAPADTLTLLTYNINPFYGDVEAKPEALTAFVAGLNPDVLTLQESVMEFISYDRTDERPGVLPWSHARPLRDVLGYNAPLPTRSGAGAGIGYARVVTLSRPMPLEMHVHTMRQRGESDALRQFVRTEHQVGDRRVALYNVHLRSYGVEKPWSDTTFYALSPSTWRPFLRRYRSSIIERANESDTLRALVEADPLPAIVAGDFNSTMHNWTYDRITGAGLDDAWRIRGGGRSATYHVEAPIARIDFVLVDPQLRVLSAELIDETALSDHFPLLVRLAWKEGEQKTPAVLPDTTR